MKYRALVAFLILGCQTREPEVKEVPKPTTPIIEEVLPPAPEPEPELSFDHELANFFTKVKKTEDQNREHNVALAAKQFDGLVLEPGENFSFNKAVGRRTAERGFKTAPVIWDGILMDGMGGGTCQVSSTLHAALLHAGIKPTERSHHSRPSSYINIGYDAAVSWPDVCETDPPKCVKLDLKFENTFDFPIKLETEYTKGAEVDDQGKPFDFPNTLDIRILGTEPSTKKVEFRTKWHETEDYKVVERPKGWGSRRTKIQDGRKGKSATLYITTTDVVTNKVTVEKLHSRYKPTNEIWEVGPDYVPPPKEEDNARSTETNDPEGRAGTHPSGGETPGGEEAGDLQGQPRSP